MKQFYFINQAGEKEYVQVTDEQQAILVELEKETRRQEDYHEYHTRSLDEITDKGHDFADANSDTETLLIDREDKISDKILLKKLKLIWPSLTKLQKKTLYKICVEGKKQNEIAEEEGITEAAISRRMEAIRKKIKKSLKNF